MEYTNTSHNQVIDPAILYFGTPVALLSTLSLDGNVNLAPMSSIFWLGNTAVLGMGGRSQTAENLLQTRECVINLPSEELVSAVDRLALTTGRKDVPLGKWEAGYRYEPDKFGRAGLTPRPAELVAPPMAAECPINMEARVLTHFELQTDDPEETPTHVFEVAIERVHVASRVRHPDFLNRIDPDRWRPLVMSFQKFYGLGSQMHPSRLSTISEEWYR